MKKRASLIVVLAVIVAGIFTVGYIWHRSNRHRTFSLPPMPPNYDTHQVFDLRNVKGDLSIKLLRKMFPKCAAFGRLDGLATIDRAKFDVSPYYIDIDTNPQFHVASLAYTTRDNMVVTTSYAKVDPRYHSLTGTLDTYHAGAAKELTHSFTLTSPLYARTATAILFPARDGWHGTVDLADSASSVNLQTYIASDTATATSVLKKAAAALKIVGPSVE